MNFLSIEFAVSSCLTIWLILLSLTGTTLASCKERNTLNISTIEVTSSPIMPNRDDKWSRIWERSLTDGIAVVKSLAILIKIAADTNIILVENPKFPIEDVFQRVQMIYNDTLDMLVQSCRDLSALRTSLSQMPTIALETVRYLNQTSTCGEKRIRAGLDYVKNIQKNCQDAMNHIFDNGDHLLTTAGELTSHIEDTMSIHKIRNNSISSEATCPIVLPADNFRDKLLDYLLTRSEFASKIQAFSPEYFVDFAEVGLKSQTMNETLSSIAKHTTICSALEVSLEALQLESFASAHSLITGQVIIPLIRHMHHLTTSVEGQEKNSDINSILNVEKSRKSIRKIAIRNIQQNEEKHNKVKQLFEAEYKLIDECDN